MGASTSKKLRQAAREAGTDKKTIARQEAAEKQAKTKRKVIIWTAIVLAFLAIVAILSFKQKAEQRAAERAIKETTAITVDGTDYTAAEMNYYFGNAYQSLLNTYSSYYGNYAAAMLGIDTSKGIAGLASEQCSMGEEGQTWRDYFLESAVNNIKQTHALTKYAEAEGIVLTDEEKQEVADEFKDLGKVAAQNNVSDADRYLSLIYGKGVNVELAKKMAEESALAQKAYSAYLDSVEVTDEEVEEQYPSINIRHILVQAAANEETGEFSDEAKAEAKAKAEEILAEWEAGEKTEESFAVLAEQYSEDPGSNTNGGLYENVLEGQMVEEFNAFCFDETRQPGDTGIVYGDNGNYAGYHVMYFSGKGDPAENETGRDYIINAKVTEWLKALTDAVTAELDENGVQYVGIG